MSIDIPIKWLEEEFQYTCRADFAPIKERLPFGIINASDQDQIQFLNRELSLLMQRLNYNTREQRMMLGDSLPYQAWKDVITTYIIPVINAAIDHEERQRA